MTFIITIRLAACEVLTLSRSALVNRN